MKPKLSLKAYQTLMHFERERIPWMFKKDLPDGYDTGDGFGVCAKNFPDGFAPVILRGARCRFEENARHMVESLFCRAIRMHRITVLSSDKISQSPEAKKRNEHAFEFSRACREKWNKRYPCQRFHWESLRGDATYILGKKVPWSEIETWEELLPLVDGLSVMERRMTELLRLRKKSTPRSDANG